MADFWRGHEIYEDEKGVWRYADDCCKVSEDSDRACGSCGKENTTEGHDGCLGTLFNVKNACCGHGQVDVAYVELDGGVCLRGRHALDYFCAARGPLWFLTGGEREECFLYLLAEALSLDLKDLKSMGHEGRVAVCMRALDGTSEASTRKALQLCLSIAGRESWPLAEGIEDGPLLDMLRGLVSCLSRPEFYAWRKAWGVGKSLIPEDLSVEDVLLQLISDTDEEEVLTILGGVLGVDLLSTWRRRLQGRVGRKD